MDCLVHEVAKSRTRLSDFHFQGIHLPTQETQETQVQSLGQEDLLEQEMAIHSSILAWDIPWTEESGGLQFIGVSKESDMTEHTHTHTHTHFPSQMHIPVISGGMPMS